MPLRNPLLHVAGFLLGDVVDGEASSPGLGRYGWGEGGVSSARLSRGRQKARAPA